MICRECDGTGEVCVECGYDDFTCNCAIFVAKECDECEGWGDDGE